MKFFILFLLLIRPLYSMDILTPPADKIEVEIYLHLINISEINDAKETTHVDFFLVSKWDDPRLKRQFKKSTRLHVDKVWLPEIQILNKIDLREEIGKTVEVSPGGKIKRIQRFAGNITMDTDLIKYPFDDQGIKIILFSPYKEVNFIKDKEKTIEYSKFTVGAWHFGKAKLFPEKIVFDKDDDLSRNALIFEIEAKRSRSYYIWRFIIPITLFLILGWGVFYISPVRVESRITISFGVILTLLAHAFIFLSRIPASHYLSKMDVFFLGSIILTFYTFAMVIITHTISEKDIEHSKIVSHRMGWVYLGMLGLLLFYLFI